MDKKKTNKTHQKNKKIIKNVENEKVIKLKEKYLLMNH